ncbi:hypothetical protein BX666DRAFT_470440 [Dichotomocladium elegans]|nr:hypothetical protein BX666DRAFT_470440 [Dichotomocladium elegans]
MKWMLHERSSFLYCRLMETYELRSMYMLNMEGLHLRLDQFAMLLDMQCPKLAAHLAAHHVTPKEYAARWYLTLFAGASTLSMDHVLQIYDQVFLLGAYETVTRYALALMQKNENELLRLDNTSSLIDYLQKHMVPVMAEEAKEIRVSREKLESMMRMQQYKRLEEKKRHSLMLKAAFEPPEKLQQTLQTALTELHKEHMRMLHGVDALRAMDHETEWLKKRQTELEARAVRYEQRLIAPEQEDQDECGEAGELRELLTYKHLNFDLAEKLTELEDKHDKALDDLRENETSQLLMEAKVDELQAALERVRFDRDQLEEERREALEEREATEQQIRQAKQTAADMQRSKLSLAKRVMSLEKRVKQLEQEKQEYMTPRESFAEEVFKAHETLFGEKKQEKTAAGPGVEEQEYRQKYYESEQQCRELEKMLADVKMKLAEHRQRKRHSGMSISSTMMPLSPSYESGRRSMDSMASCGSKRSSIYSRIWNSFGSTAATSPASSVACKSPVLASTRPVDLIEEPEEII